MPKNKKLFTGVDWDVDLVKKMWKVVDKIGRGYGLSYPEPQIEIVTADQMIMNSVTIGLPETYSHWSFGKDFLETHDAYSKGRQGLAYEMIINTDPPVAYLMENNSATTQALVLAHACCGHADFFHNNYLFKKYTHPEFIVSYCKYAKRFMEKAEEKLGADRVEELLDAAHSLKYHAVDNYLRLSKTEEELEELRRIARIENEIETYNPLHDLLTKSSEGTRDHELAIHKLLKSPANLNLPEENILYFIEKYSPRLLPMEREILRIVRNISQYFFPQGRTKVMNEGWATFWHHQIMDDLWEQGYIDEGAYLEFIHLHTGVIRQANAPTTPVPASWHRPKDERGYYGINPYALGFAIWKDIQRICMSPTEEDKKWFPTIVNTDWKKTLLDIRENFIDSSFILQFLSLKVVRDFKFFVIESDEDLRNHHGDRYDLVSEIQADEDFLKIRQQLSDQYNFSKLIPHIEIVGCDLEEGRILELKHTVTSGIELDEASAGQVRYGIELLWGYAVKLNTLDYEYYEDEDDE